MKFKIHNKDSQYNHIKEYFFILCLTLDKYYDVPMQLYQNVNIIDIYEI